MPAVDVVTHPEFAYLRCHGRNPRWPEEKSAEAKHRYAYSDAEHDELAVRAQALARQVRTVHIIANNHAEDYAPRTALALQQLLHPRTSPGAPPSQTAERAWRPGR